MAVVTINGQPGSGGREMGIEVARLLGVDLVNQQILVEAAQRLGTTVEALPEQEFYTLSLRDRLARLLQRALRSPGMMITGEIADVDAMLARSYADVSQSPTSKEQELDDARFLAVTRGVMQEVAHQGNAVILGRGSNIILGDAPEALHVGLVAPLELRVRRLMERDGLAWQEAEQRAQREDRARVAYFRKFFNVHPNDPLHYDLMLNMGRLDLATAADIVAHQGRRIWG